MLAKEFDFIVKKEPEDDEEWYVNEAVNVCSNCSEKDVLIKQIKDELESKTQKVFGLETDLKRMADAHRIEIQELEVKLQRPNNNNENDGFYEVESLLDHKQVGCKLQFFVQWKGYDESHNTWVEKKDLHRKNLLQKYLKSKNLK